MFNGTGLFSGIDFKYLSMVDDIIRIAFLNPTLVRDCVDVPLMVLSYIENNNRFSPRIVLNFKFFKVLIGHKHTEFGIFYSAQSLKTVLRNI